METLRRMKISGYIVTILEGIFLDFEMRCDIMGKIYDDVNNRLKDVDYNDIYISKVQKAVAEVLYDKIMLKIH